MIQAQSSHNLEKLRTKNQNIEMIYDQNDQLKLLKEFTIRDIERSTDQSNTYR